MQRHVADQRGLPSLFGLTSLGTLVSNPLNALEMSGELVLIIYWVEQNIKSP